jgi:chromosome partitioning protein
VAALPRRHIAELGERSVQTIVIANPKGGSGKTTLATNIAGWIAGKRQRVVLADADPQRSSTQWLQRRPRLFPAIAGHEGDLKKKSLKDLAPDYVVVDMPAGAHREALRDVVKQADVMVVPLAASTFDMAATQRFLATLAEFKTVKEDGLALGLVANRVDPRTRAAGELDEFLDTFDFPLIAHLRDTQVYVHCARDGLSVFDLPRSRAEQDWEQWKPLTRWIAKNARAK